MYLSFRHVDGGKATSNGFEARKSEAAKKGYRFGIEVTATGSLQITVSHVTGKVEFLVKGPLKIVKEAANMISLAPGAESGEGSIEIKAAECCSVSGTIKIGQAVKMPFYLL